MKLYTYQKELVNSKGKNVYINWSRGAGLSTAIAHYIVENKPKRVLYNDYMEIRQLLAYFEELKSEYGFKVKLNNSLRSIDLHFPKTDMEITIQENCYYDKYDLLISESNVVQKANGELGDIRSINAETKFTIKRGNIHNQKDFSGYDFTSTVDYKKGISEGQLKINKIIEFSQSDENSFYEEYAILDKPKEDAMTFESFKSRALQKLQKQFLNTPDTKDTVLTRKNIIEMIKDLKTIS